EVWDPEGLAQDEVLEEDRFAAPFAGLKGHLQCMARCSRGLIPVLRGEALLDERSLGALAKELSRTRA
ncbi:MAG TPA: hypothetical protein VNZ67_09720, partial [bacterium]|nr:hypothetical protein [bacterium]